ncbi:MAG: tRNA lysidine(34) synthetase TilS [Bacteroidales bacterium]|nr:tRNA lysidine(34) synthetase TilS [Bacteroidales bacterium]
MLEQFKSYLKNTLSLTGNEKILLAVSGGADSMVMLDLFVRSNYTIAVAHCNFHLRGIASYLDARLAKELAEKHNAPFFLADFDTFAYAEKNRISIEMAARELRYEWFEKIRKENKYDYIATAHHSDDVIETFFLNLVRGSGVRGLSGIKEKSGKLIRPLLFADRNQIQKYIDEHNLKYREDDSNKDTRYKRNKLRHDIIPQFSEINPAYKANILKSIELLNVTNDILSEKVLEIKNKIVTQKGVHLFYDTKKILALTNPEFYLFELLYPYGYNASQVEDIVRSLRGMSGKVFYTNEYQLIKDRKFLILSPIRNQKEEPFVYLFENQNELIIHQKIKFTIEHKQVTSDFKIPVDAQIAVLDKNKLKFPLTIRRWEYGDYFYPLGMKQKKKLSDFLIDQKVPTVLKRNVFVLLSGKDIVWVIGLRIDNRYKIHPDTENIMQISSEII